MVNSLPLFRLHCKKFHILFAGMGKLWKTCEKRSPYGYDAPGIPTVCAAENEKSPLGKDVCLAFLVGGAICALGQAVLDGWISLGLSEEDAGTATSCTLVALSSLLTGLNLYNKLARFGGAGTLVPITGFSNAVTSPALDFKSEGFVTGMAAKMFTVAGPVITFGTLASAIYGVILMLLK